MTKQNATDLRLQGNGPHTDKLAAALTPPGRRHPIRWDCGSGFGIRVTATGAKSFILRYRNATGDDKQTTIGSPPAWDVAKARKHADMLRHQIDNGGDPLAERQTVREAPTMADLADRFETEHLKRRRPATVRDHTAMLGRHILPVLGRMKVDAVRSGDVEALHRKISATAPYAANRTVAVLSKMFALAIKWEMRSNSLARGIERAPEEKRERFLTPAKIAALSDALARHPETVSANAMRLLLLTGARIGEMLSTGWDQFDLANGVWVKPAASTKRARTHRIPLSAPARQLLTEMKAEADTEAERRSRHGLPPIPFVFPGNEGKSLTDIKHFWASVSRKAGIGGARIHDLRHTHASILAGLGLSLPIIGALLGRTQVATTSRYAHLLDDPLRAATERAGAIVAGAGKIATGAEIIPLRKEVWAR